MKRTFVQRILIAAIGTISLLSPCLKVQEERFALTTIQAMNCQTTKSPDESGCSIGESVTLLMLPKTTTRLQPKDTINTIDAIFTRS